MKSAPIVFDEVLGNGPSDIRVFKSLVVMTILFWLSEFVITFVSTAFYMKANIQGLLQVRAALAGLGIICCLGLHLVLRLTDRQPLPLRSAIAALLLPPIVAVYALLSNLIARAIEPQLANSDVMELTYSLIVWLWLFVAWTAAYFAIYYSVSAVAEERRSRRMRELAHAAQLRALHHQINPHFLFNTINSVSSLVLARQLDAAEEMLSNLSTYFRSSLAIDLEDKITLRQEIELQELYLEIERVRFPDVDFATSIDPAALELMVPPLILQPIVENAIRHAVARTSRATSLRLSAELLGDMLFISFSDDGVGTGTSVSVGTGTGLRNVAERLKTLFGNRQTFDARGLDPEGFRVRLSMPAERPV